MPIQPNDIKTYFFLSFDIATAFEMLLAFGQMERGFISNVCTFPCQSHNTRQSKYLLSSLDFFYLGSIPFLIFHEFFLLLYFIASSQIFFAKNHLYWFFHKKKICMLCNQYFWEQFEHFVYANIIQYKK